MELELTIIKIDNNDETVEFTDDILVDIWNQFTDTNKKIPDKIEYNINNKKYIITFNYMVRDTGLLEINGNYILGLKSIEDNKQFIVIINNNDENK